jgi:thiosulfate/3-mercaptopyruvate sulfurtransferase
MSTLVSMDWVADHLGQREFMVVDVRRPMKYLSGHLPGAINIPAYKAFAPNGRLLDPESLAQLISEAGLGDGVSPIIYDSPEGRDAALMSWVLEYLGCNKINLMDSFFEVWKASGREITYKPCVYTGQRFTVHLRPWVRATLDEVRDSRVFRLVDFRSSEEYCGVTKVGDDAAGHIPGALNIVWRDLVDAPRRLLKPLPELTRIANSVGLQPGDNVVAYCRSGSRAALGYLALNQLGIGVRLFDGSFAEWSQAGLPVET